MSETLEEKVKSLSSNIENLTKSVDQLNGPDMSGIHHDEQGRLAAYWETEKIKRTIRLSKKRSPGRGAAHSPLVTNHFQNFNRLEILSAVDLKTVVK